MTTALNPIAYARLLTTVSTQVLPSNPTRSGLVFFNCSRSVSIAFCPAFTVDSNGTPVALAAVVDGAGSLTLQPTGFAVLDEFNVTAAWNAIAASGVDNPLTIWELT